MSKKSFHFTNAQVAELLNNIAAAYEVKGENRFRISAYNRAAAAVATSSSEIKDLYDEGKLDQIPAVGPNIAAHLDELFRTGRVRHFQQVLHGLPPAMFVFLTIPGIGPKSAYKLCLKLRITKSGDALDKLKQAALGGKISLLAGFGKQSEKEILENLKRAKKSAQRMILPYARDLAGRVIAYLRQNGAGLRIEPLGSLRRMTSTVGDIDLAVATRKPAKTIAVFAAYPESRQIVARGQNTARILHSSGRQIDLKTISPDAFGSLLQHYTGSKDHNIRLRELALKKGLSLSEYGIKNIRSGKLAQFRTEKEFYAALGLPLIPPELRENNGEIEAAVENDLPELISSSTLKGDLHIHSDFPIEGSHDAGLSSLADIAAKGKQLNYRYLGIAEHNPSQSAHTDSQIIRLLEKKRQSVVQYNYSNTHTDHPYVFNGLEIDIRPDGELALPKKAFSFLDYAIVSIHNSFDLPKKQMTARVLWGLSHPKVKIFGHPLGRKLNVREGIELDWEAVFSFCLANNKWLEINSWPERLDLPDFLVREAVKKGVKLIINSDAHESSQLFMIEYGVSVARRGWAGPSDVVNHLSLADFRRQLINQ